MIITISTAPIFNNQLVTKGLVEVSTDEIITTTEPIAYQDDKSESDEDEIQLTTVEDTKETTSIPEVVTGGLLFVNDTDIALDIESILKTIDPLLSENEAELPATPTTESPEAAQPSTID
jgi:hypothetical protein